MEYDDFKKEYFAIEKDAERKKTELAKKYALSHNTVKIGDVVRDHSGQILVEKILTRRSRQPDCVYVGIEVTKKGVPFKKGSRREVFQCNIKSS